MSLESKDVNPRYVRMLNELEKIGGINNLLKNSHPKFEILKTKYGARIQASISIGDLDPDLRSFVINSYASQDMILHEQIMKGDTESSTFVFFKEVSENYIGNQDHFNESKKYVGKLFFEPLNNSKKNLISHVKGTGFPGGPFSSDLKSKNADKKQENSGYIRRFLNKISDISPSLG